MIADHISQLIVNESKPAETTCIKMADSYFTIYLAFCHGEPKNDIEDFTPLLLVRSAHNYRLLFKTNRLHQTTCKEKVVIVFSVKLESRCTRRPWKAATCILTLLAKGSVS